MTDTERITNEVYDRHMLPHENSRKRTTMHATQELSILAAPEFLATLAVIGGYLWKLIARHPRSY